MGGSLGSPGVLTAVIQVLGWRPDDLELILERRAPDLVIMDEDGRRTVVQAKSVPGGLAAPRGKIDRLPERDRQAVERLVDEMLGSE